MCGWVGGWMRDMHTCACLHHTGKVVVIYDTINIVYVSDINECLEGDNVCGSNGVCHNTVGSYRCVCVAGFHQVGHFCYGKSF